MTEAPSIKESARQPTSTTLNRKYQVFEAWVDTSEVVTLNIGTLVGTYVCKASDGSAVAHTKATTKITITEGALTNEHVYGMGVGAA